MTSTPPPWGTFLCFIVLQHWIIIDGFLTLFNRCQSENNSEQICRLLCWEKNVSLFSCRLQLFFPSGFLCILQYSVYPLPSPAIHGLLQTHSIKLPPLHFTVGIVCFWWWAVTGLSQKNNLVWWTILILVSSDRRTSFHFDLD